MTLRVAVVGGPITRDALTARQSDFDVTRYFARSSLACLATEAVDDLPLERVSSEFRRRLVEQDASRALLEAVASRSTDLIVLDGTEERFNLARLASGKLLTLSSELREVGLDSSQFDVVAARSEEHYELWEQGWQTLVTRLEASGMLEALRVHEAYFAERTVSQPTPAGVASAQALNGFLARIYQRMRRDVPGEQFLSLPAELRVALDGTPPNLSALIDEYRHGLARQLAASIPQDSVDVAPLVLAELELGRGPILASTVLTADAPHQQEFKEAKVTVSGAPARVERDGEVTRIIIDMPHPRRVRNGVGIRFKVSGWSTIGSCRIGNVENDVVAGLRYRHLLQDVWLTEVFGFCDPMYRISNRWRQDSAHPIGQVAIEVTGELGAAGGRVDIGWAVTFLEGSPAALRPSWQQRGVLAPEPERRALVEILHSYLLSHNQYAIAQAQEFLRSGRLPVFQDVTYLDWPAAHEAAVSDGDLGTHRYLHHSLNVAGGLMVLARRDDDHAAAAAARDLCTQWMDAHLFTDSADPVYAWYDHGTPSRLFTLLLLWDWYCSEGRDARFTARLEYALEVHGRLLSLDAFYAYYQQVRYQNHAWFQDVGLMAFGAFIGASPLGQRLIDMAVTRLSDQFERLIVTDGDHAIWSENSIGYHVGLISLIRFTRSIAHSVGREPWQDLTERMQEWASVITYPDGRMPAVGDTIPSPPSSGGTSVDLPAAVWSWPVAGYAQARGAHDGRPFQIFFTGSSVNEVHKHRDNLTFSLWFDGVEWLVDPGLIDYDARQPTSTYARGPWAHNGVVLPASEYSIAPRQCQINAARFGDEFEVSGVHTSYADASVRRRWRGPLGRLALECVDEVDSSSDAVVAVTIFRSGLGTRMSWEDGSAVLRNASSAFQLRITCNGTSDVVSGWNGEGSESSIISTGLSKYEPTYSLRVTHPEKEPLRWLITAEPRSASAIVASDYERVGLDLRSWSSVQDFSAAWRGEPGIHAITLSGGNHIDVAVRGDVLDMPHDSIPVFLAGAVSQRRGSAPPFFAGQSLTLEMGLPWISLSDPGLQLDEDILLAWFTGEAGTRTQSSICDILSSIAAAVGKKLLLVGGSGGGFAALVLAARLGPIASAFVWNPQTAILDYEPFTVAKYLATLFPGRTLDHTRDRQAAVAALEEAGIQHQVDDVSPAAGALVLQNGQDWHVISHLVPWLQRVGAQDLGQHAYGPDRDHVAIVAAWGDGHAPLPAEAVRLGIRALISGRAPMDVGREIVAAVKPEGYDDAELPRALGDEAGQVSADLAVSLERTGKAAARVSWTVLDRPAGYAGIFLSVLNLDAEPMQRVRVESVQGERILTVPEAETRLRLVFRDGFGHQVALRDVVLPGWEG